MTGLPLSFSSVETLASLASIATFLAALMVYGQASRQAKAHLRAHLELLEHWVAGNYGTGWSPATITPANQLRWMLPEWHVIKNHSAGPISQLSLLQQFTIDPRLTPSIVRVSQALKALNDAIDRVENFKLSEPDRFTVVAAVLRVRMDQALGVDAMPAADLTQEQLDKVMCQIAFDDRDRIWLLTMRRMVQSLYLDSIGTDESYGLRSAVTQLRRQFDLLHGD